MISASPTTPGNGTQGSALLSYATSPTSARSQTFKRPASSDEDDGDAPGGRGPGSRRNTAVKRACNECRQQKVRPELTARHLNFDLLKELFAKRSASSSGLVVYQILEPR